MKFLITGATGNVGGAVLDKLNLQNVDIYAGVRNLERARRHFNRKNYKLCVIDFEKKKYPQIDFDAVFLIRPPQLAEPDLFRQYLKTLKLTTKVVFLSVQGAERKSYLPHAKIEKVIRDLGLKHIFIRPTYFMENLTTTLWNELVENHRIYLPSADLKFNWITVSDMAEVVKKALECDLNVDSLEIVGSSNLNFQQVISAVNNICGTNLAYVSPSLIEFVIYNLKKGKKLSYILIMLLLHYLPRFSKQKNLTAEGGHPQAPPILGGERMTSTDFERVIGRKPMTIEKFIHDNCDKFQLLKG